MAFHGNPKTGRIFIKIVNSTPLEIYTERRQYIAAGIR
jgi:hypothetical protein